MEISSCLGCTSVRPEQFYCRAADPSRAKTSTFAASPAGADQIYAGCDGEEKVLMTNPDISRDRAGILPDRDLGRGVGGSVWQLANRNKSHTKI